MNTAEDSSHFGEMSSAAFLVYIAAVLFYKPIFTQPLRFGLCAAGAVEKFATDRAVSVVYLRDTISISKINAAVLTGQQIDRIQVQQLLFTMFVCKPHNTQRLLLYHEPSNSSIDPYAKKVQAFSWDVTIDILKSVPPGRAACIEKCRSKGFGALPNKHFATQKVFLYRRKHCLLGHFSSGVESGALPLPEFRIATNCCSCLRELTPSFS